MDLSGGNMATITRFEEIHAWQTARELTKQIYQLTNTGDFKKDFGLRDQIRRAAISVMSNIAEGFESKTQALFLNYLGFAKASGGEVRSQLYVAFDLGYITEDQFNFVSDIAMKASSQIYRFSRYLRSKPNSRRVSEHSVNYDLI